jgi:hypothetical protein
LAVDEGSPFVVGEGNHGEHADFVAVQGMHAARVPSREGDLTGPGTRRYLLAGLLTCGTCGRRMESAVQRRARLKTGEPPRPPPPRRLPALHLLLTRPVGRRRRRTCGGINIRTQATPKDVTRYLRDQQLTLTYDPAAGTLRAGRRPSGSPFMGRCGEWLVSGCVSSSIRPAGPRSNPPLRSAAGQPTTCGGID